MLFQKAKIFQKSPLMVIEILIASCLGLLLGIVSILASPIWVMLVFGGYVFALAAFKRHELLLFVFVILTSTIIGPNYSPHVNIGVGNIYLTDMILLASFGLIVLRSIAELDFNLIHTPIDFPLLVFVIVALFSTTLFILQAPAQLAALKETLGAMRTVTGYLTFFIVTNLIRKETQLNRLWRGVFAFAIFTALAMVVQYLLGSSIQIIPGRVETLSTEGVRFGEITRIIPPGESIVFFVFVFTTISVLLRAPKSARVEYILAWGLLGLGTLLTYKRHLFIAIGVAIIILYVLINSRNKARLLAWSIVSIGIITISVFVISLFPTSKAMGFLTATSGRFLSLANRQTYTDPYSSFQWRSFEYKYAVPQIESHPLLGLGMDTIYRPFVPGRDYLPGGDFRRFVHNGHLAILLRTGVLGYLLFLWLSILFIYRGIVFWRDIPDVRYQILVLSLALSYVGILIGSVASPILISENWTPVLGIMFGINEVVLNCFDVKQIRAERLNTEVLGYQKITG